MKVSDLVKCKLTGKHSIVTWVDGYNGSHFKVMGYPINQVFNSTRWQKIPTSVTCKYSHTMVQ